MSEDITMSGPADRYLQLRAQRTALGLLAESGSEELRVLYDEVITNADAQLSELEQNPTVIADVMAIGEQTLRVVSEIDSLRPQVATGLLSEASLQAKRDEMLEDPRRKAAVEFMKKSGVATSAVKAAVESPAESPEPQPPVTDPTEQDRTLRQVTLTIQEDAIKVGVHGRTVKLSTSHKGQTDYSQRNQALLTTLIKHGEEISPNDLWDATFPGEAFDKMTLHRFREWSTNKLTHRRTPLILHNGKRSFGSRYSINPVFELSLVVQNVTEREVPIDHAHVTPARSRTPRTGESDTTASPATTVLERQPEARAGFPLSTLESSVVASFIGLHTELLEANFDIPPMSQELIDSLSDKATAQELDAEYAYLSNELRSQGFEPTREKLLGLLRTKSLEKLQKFFDNEKAVFTAISEMSVKDDKYKLFEYLCDIEDDERWQLFNTLVSAKTTISLTADRRGMVRDITRSTDLGTGPTLSRVIAGAKPAEQTGRNVVGDDSDQASANEATATAVSPVPPVAETTLAAEAAIEQSPPTPEEKFPELVQKLRQDVREWLAVIDKYSLGGKDSGFIHASFLNEQLSFPYLRANAFNQASAFLSKRGDFNELSLAMSVLDILKFNAFHTTDYSKAISVTNSRTNPDRRLVIRVIRDEMERHSVELAKKSSK